MTTYLISFRIEYDSTYTDRWSSIVGAIHSEADSGTYWEETSSLIVLKSSKSPDDLAFSIYVGSQFNAATDKLLVVDAMNGTHATRGKIDYPATLASLFAKRPLSIGLGVFGAR